MAGGTYQKNSICCREEQEQSCQVMVIMPFLPECPCPQEQLEGKGKGREGGGGGEEEVLSAR